MKKTAFKIHILYEFQEGPWGGGNQFLKALREYFRKAGVYAESPDEAQGILFNSHHCLEKIISAREKYADRVFLHRVDGPISYVRGTDRATDDSIFRYNSLCADGTVFQSDWSRQRNYEIGMKKASYETIIMNATDPAIFNPKSKGTLEGRKIKLIATSWSGNMRRGFEVYQYLDKTLDFDRYEMTFVGNSPIEFKNIKWLKPVQSEDLAGILWEHDIYITASWNDPCSNALIEALHCGLPAVARNDGGHPGIIGQAGALFQDQSGVIKAIEKVAQDYQEYREKINLSSLDETGDNYYQFAQTIYVDYLKGNYRPKQVGILDVIAVRLKTAPSGIRNSILAIIRNTKNKNRGD